MVRSYSSQGSQGRLKSKGMMKSAAIGRFRGTLNAKTPMYVCVCEYYVGVCVHNTYKCI